MQRLAALTEAGLAGVADEVAASGGRPATLFGFDEQAGVVLVGDLGQTGCHLAVTDLAARPLAQHTAPLSIAEGPGPVLRWLQERFDALLAEVGRGRDEVLGIGLGVPGPVDHATGRPISPPAMPGWDGEEVPARLRDFAPCPVLVDSDVRIMALGEHREARSDDRVSLFVKVGSGIGAGVVVDGQVLRGAFGAAGDIGHVVVEPGGGEVCACGNVGCLDAVAGGWAITRRLGEAARTPPDVVRLVREGHPDAIREVRRTGRHVGQAVASAVNLLNPSALIIGGRLAQADEQLFAAVREAVYRRATPLASRDLDIALSRLGHEAGIIGAAHMVIDHVFAPARIDARLAAGSRA